METGMGTGRGVDKAVLLVNLGSPNSPSIPDVRAYLAEFLMDKRVLDIPWPLRAGIVYGSILRTRPAETAKAYASIWTDKGSPLIVTSESVLEALQKDIQTPLFLAMRYGQPSIKSTLKKICEQYPHLKSLLVIPLYPHFAMSSTETVVVEVRRWLKAFGPHIHCDIFPSFYNHPFYINALAETLKPYVSSPYDYLLFSYHGLPERHLKKSDPTGEHCLVNASCCSQPSEVHTTCYRYQTYETTRLVAEALGLKSNTFSQSFQSRLGKDPWIKPYTDEVIVDLAKQGVKKLIMISPAFVSDCLETIEELGERAKHDFLQAGGEHFDLVPCLNTHPLWINTLNHFISSKGYSHDTVLNPV
jgi:ferrochelatase